MPRLAHDLLTHYHHLRPRSSNDDLLRRLLREQQRTNRLLRSVLVFGLALGAGAAVAHFWLVSQFGF